MHLVGEEGPDHDKTFIRSNCQIGETGAMESEKDVQKRAAEQEAAYQDHSDLHEKQ